MIRTGDTVFHRPSGERWLVACVRDEQLSWCGWPEGWAQLSDCELVKTCTDEQHWKLVEEIARSSQDHRGRYCRWLLEQRIAQGAQG